MDGNCRSNWHKWWNGESKRKIKSRFIQINPHRNNKETKCFHITKEQCVIVSHYPYRPVLKMIGTWIQYRTVLYVYTDCSLDHRATNIRRAKPSIVNRQSSNDVNRQLSKSIRKTVRHSFLNDFKSDACDIKMEGKKMIGIIKVMTNSIKTIIYRRFVQNG